VKSAVLILLLLFCSRFTHGQQASGAPDFRIPASLGAIFEKPWSELSTKSSIELGTAGGDKLQWRFDPASDSGVELERISKDKVVWRSHVLPLGVEHSKYHHSVTVKIEDEKVMLTSTGAATIDEVIDLGTGRQISREVKWPTNDMPVAPVEKAWQDTVDGDFLKGEFFDLDGNRNDRLYLRYGPISDSGVEIERIKDGKLLWRVHMQYLGVDHSKYSHSIHTRIREGKVMITSKGAGMVFEKRDLRTGQLLLRKIGNNP